MSKSLQDQLLALGLAAKKPKKARQATRRASGKVNQQPGAGKGPSRGGQVSGGEVSLDRAYALRKQEEKKHADTARKRKRAEDRQRRQLNKEIRAIVSKYRLDGANAEVSRHFMYRGRIRKINVTPDQLKALNTGGFGIAYLSGGYHLLAPEHLEAVRKLSANHIPDLASGEPAEENDYPVPDELTW